MTEFFTTDVCEASSGSAAPSPPAPGPSSPQAAGDLRLTLLRELLRATEGLYDGAGDPELAGALLSRRELLILRIRQLDVHINQRFSAEAMAPFREGARSLIQTILQLEPLILERMEAGRNALLAEIRGNTGRQKMAAYAQPAASDPGSRLDYKK